LESEKRAAFDQRTVCFPQHLHELVAYRGQMRSFYCHMVASSESHLWTRRPCNLTWPSHDRSPGMSQWQRCEAKVAAHASAEASARAPSVLVNAGRPSSGSTDLCERFESRVAANSLDDSQMSMPIDAEAETVPNSVEVSVPVSMVPGCAAPCALADVPARLLRQSLAVSGDTFCFGNVVINTSHRLAYHRGCLWCWACAGYSYGQAAFLLARACRRSVTSRWGATVLRRVRDGLAPRNDKPWPCEDGPVPPALLRVANAAGPAGASALRLVLVPPAAPALGV
jgi:hypothetical protein